MGGVDRHVNSPGHAERIGHDGVSLPPPPHGQGLPYHPSCTVGFLYSPHQQAYTLSSSYSTLQVHIIF